MTNYYNSLGRRMDTNPNNTKIATRCWQLCLMLVFSLFLGQLSFAQVGSYTFAQSAGVYTDLTSPTVLGVPTGNATATSLDDAIFNLPSGSFPFTFTFDNVGYTGCNISTNGFITFGATAPAATNYTPISNVATYSGAIAAWGSDANSPFALGGKTGSISWKVEGIAPNREIVIQWKDVRPAFSISTTLVPFINYQIRLQETSNKVVLTYGTSGLAVGITNTSRTMQIGLRGPNNTFATSVQNRTNTPAVSFNSSVVGTANTSTQAYASVTALPGRPTSGLVYTFTPPPPPTCGVATGLTVSDNVSGATVDLAWTAPTLGPPVSYDWEIRTTGAGGSGAVGLINSASTSGLTVNDASGLTPGTAYSLYVRTNCGGSGFSTWAGPATFTSSTPGESCVTAPLISVATNLAASVNTLLTTGSTSDGPNGTCSDGTGNPSKKDRWVKFVAPSSGNKVIVTTSAGTLADAVMQVWSSCPASGTALGCSDDFSGTNFMPELEFCTLTPGDTYYVQVWPYGAATTGNFNIKIYENVACAVPPPNNECATVQTLTVQTSGSFPADAILGSTIDATASPGIVKTTCDLFGTYQDVFYKFNSGSNTELQFDFSSLTGTCEFGLYSDCGLTYGGVCSSSATAAAPFSSIITGLTASTDYYVVVWSNSVATQGTFNLRVAALSVPLCVIAPTAPLDGGTACETVTLDWPVVAGATTYDVFVDGLLVSDNLAATLFTTTVTVGAHTWSVVPANSAGEATGCSTFSFTASAAPIGDTFANPILIGALTVAPYSNSGDTLDANCWSDNYTTASTPGNALARASNDVFYKFDVTDLCNTVTIGTCSGTITDTYLHLLDSTGVRINGDDDSCTTPNGNGSLLTVTNLAPGTYYVVVEAFGANVEGTYVLDIAYTTTPAITYYADADGDTFGNPAVSIAACTAPTGYVTDNTDCLDTDATANPEASEVSFDGIDNNCNGIIDEGSILTTNLVASSCNITVPTLAKLLFFNSAANATRYRVRATNAANPLDSSVYETTSTNFRFTNFGSYEFGTTYNIDVMVQRLGVWLNYYGPACPVTTNVVPTLTVGAACVTNITTRFSGITTTNVAGALQYKFRVLRVAPGAVAQEITTNWNGFLMHYIGGFVYGSTYNVEVAVKTPGASAFSAYGSPCVVNTPAVPTLAAGSCDVTITSKFQAIATTNLLTNATGYKFEITSLAGVVFVEQASHWFYPTTIPGYVAGTNYSVRVAVKNGADISEYGEVCELNPVVPARFGQAGTPSAGGTDFKAVGYPNPFATNFILNVTTTSDEKVKVSVYDMIGKQLESKEVNATDANTLEVGANYPSGVYNVIVSQGVEVKSLRMIKR